LRLSGRAPPSLSLVITAGIAGALLLARARPEGYALMETTAAGAWRSFVAAVICLPAFLALRLLSATGTFGLRGLATDVIGYVIAWVGFALISLVIADAWGRHNVWPRFITAWNWITIVQYLVLLATVLPGAWGLPAILANALALIGLGYALWLGWFVARDALGITGVRALVLLVADQVFGLFVGGLMSRVAG
jgi:hypothetical protein